MAPRAAPNPIFRSADDATLIRRLVDRRQEALAELYDRYAPLLLALSRRIVGDVAEAEEVLQETFLQAWGQATRYDSSRASVSTWLVLICRSRSLDRLRNRRARARLAEGAAAEPAPGADESSRVEEHVLTFERRERIHQALAALPLEQREVIELSFYEGLSQTEIAERTKTPLGTVKTRSLLGMKKLRQLLRDEVRSLL